jgi:hypothetical protein
VQLILEQGHDAEIATPAAQAPEEVGVLRGAGDQQLTVGGDHVSRQQVVARQAVPAVQPAQTAAEGQSGDACVGDDAQRGGQSELLRLAIELAQPQAGLGDRRLPRCIHAQALHIPEIDEQAAITRGVAGDAVPATTDGHHEVVLARELD